MLRSELRLPDKIRYLRNAMLGRPAERYRLTGGGAVRLRPGTTDLKVFDEVFVDRVYAPALAAAPGPVRTMVDLGANIGLSTIDLLRRFPQARAVAVEPDAGNFRLLEENLRSAHVADRCQAIQAFVGARPGFAELVDSGNGAWGMRMGAPSADGVPVMTLAGIADRAGMDEVSLVKCDIEGSERDLLADIPAWEARARFVVMELHADLFPVSEFEACLNASAFEWIRHGRTSASSPLSVLALTRGAARSARGHTMARTVASAASTKTPLT